MELKNILYSVACLSFSIVIGAAVYEHMSVVPQWSAAPPVSLSMFQGKYGLNPTPFWKAIHPVTVFLLTIVLWLNWNTVRRPYILATYIGYLIVLVITFSFFVPQLITITGTPYGTTINPDLVEKAGLWESMSLVRLSVLIVLAIIGLLGLSKSETTTRPIL